MKKVNKEIPKLIKVTKENYKNFKISDKNRDLNQHHINKLNNSFKELKAVIEFPVCDINGTIIEGAHRFKAFLDMGFERAEKLGIDFYIIYNPSATEDLIGAVNAFNKKWALDDYYKFNGYEELIKFKLNGINSQTACRILKIKNNELKQGTVNIKECKTYDKLNEFSEFFDTANVLLAEKIGKKNARGNRFYALVSFYIWNTEGVNQSRLKTIMTSEGPFTNINSFSALNECAKKFVEVYNKKLLKENRILFNESDFTFEI